MVKAKHITQEECDSLNDLAAESETDLEELKYELENGTADYIIGNYDELKRRIEIAGLWNNDLEDLFKVCNKYNVKFISHLNEHVKVDVYKVAVEAKKVGADNVSEKVNELAFGNYNKYFKPTKTAYDWLCCSEEGIKEYIDDPDTYKFITPGMFMDLLGGMARVNKKEAVRNSKMVPVLFLAGNNDPVGEFGKGVKKAANVFAEVNPDVEVKMYPDSRHDIFHDNFKDFVMTDICEWLNKH
mgnify:CR=1 FL=1